MDINARIYVAGHRGLVGSAIVENLQRKGYRNLLLRTHAELDLTDAGATGAFFSENKPEYVFLAAAKVGGIHANNTYPAEFIYVNLQIQANVINAAWKSQAQRLLFLGSSCIYPRLAPQPMKEEYLLTGLLEATNQPYAIAKIAGIEMCDSYNRQYGTRYLAVMPTNLYGPGDNYDLDNSHVIPALINKFHRAKEDDAPFVEVWGTGTPRREFLFNRDMADACVHLMNLDDAAYSSLLESKTESGLRHSPLINIGVGEDVTIRELAELVGKVIAYRGEIRFDPSKPDGTPRKLMDVSRLSNMGWRASTSLEDGLRQAYEAYQPIAA